MSSLASMVQAFRTHGRKITPQRRLIFQALAVGQRHPTAEQIYQEVAAVLGDTSRTTVYNTLHELVALGELQEIDLGDGRTRYDSDPTPHHHLHCLRCHTLIDLHEQFAGLDVAPEARAGFTIVARRVIFDGYCPACQDQ